MEYPAIEPPGKPEAQDSSWGEHKNAHEVLRGPHSEWLSRKMQEFGEVLGASYVGFEDRVLALLCAIEVELGISKPGVVSGKDKSLVSREVRNLISNVNYDGGSTKRTTSASARALTLSQ